MLNDTPPVEDWRTRAETRVQVEPVRVSSQLSRPGRAGVKVAVAVNRWPTAREVVGTVTLPNWVTVRTTAAGETAAA